MSYSLSELARLTFVEDILDTPLRNAFVAFRREMKRRGISETELPPLSDDEKALVRGLAGLSAVGSYHRRTHLSLDDSQQAIDDYRNEFAKAGGKIAQWPDSLK